MVHKVEKKKPRSLSIRANDSVIDLLTVILYRNGNYKGICSEKKFKAMTRKAFGFQVDSRVINTAIRDYALPKNKWIVKENGYIRFNIKEENKGLRLDIEDYVTSLENRFKYSISRYELDRPILDRFIKTLENNKQNGK